METLWFVEYDNISLETDFFNINFTSLLEQAVSNPDTLNLAQVYTFSNNKFENTLEKYLTEFLEIFKNFFQDLLEISDNENLLNFSKSVLLYIQVERLYFLSYWRIITIDNFVMNRLISSYLRIKNLLTSFHLNCFPKLYRAKELNEAVGGAKHRKRFSLTKSDQSGYDLLFKRSEELKIFQNYLCNTFDAILKVCKKQKNNVENINNFFKKIHHYSKNIINKNAIYLKQENENLFGNTSEKILIEKILTENRTKIELIRKENEKEDLLKRNQNSLNSKFDTKVSTFSNKLIPLAQIREKDSRIDENKVLNEIIKETENINRRVSVVKNLDNVKKNDKVSKFNNFSGNEDNVQNIHKNSLFSKSKQFIPPPPPPPNIAMLNEQKLAEDPLIKESIMKSLTFYFKREEKLPGKDSKTSETLNKIKSNFTDIIDERKINKYKTLNEKLHSNLEDLINDLNHRKEKIKDAYKDIIMETNNLFDNQSGSLSLCAPNKHHSIEMVSGDKFSENYSCITSPKYNNTKVQSINEKEEREKEKSIFLGQGARPKFSVLNVIKENEENDIKEHKISQITDISTFSNSRNAHALTTLSSPLLNRSSQGNLANFPFSILNFFRNSLKSSTSFHRSPVNKVTLINPTKLNKLNISEKDIIKIDSNTEINEELKYMKIEERMSGSMLRDEDLFSKKKNYI